MIKKQVLPENHQPETRILVVEDNQDQMLILSEHLQDAGFRVEQAVHGAAALEIMARYWPDLILLDARLPVMDGYETCRQIRALPGGERIPIIFMTSLDDENSVERAFTAGVTDYLVKPIRWTMLNALIRNWLRLFKAERQFQVLAESATDGIISIDSQGMIRYLNPAIEKLFGYTAAELEGQELSLLMPEEFRSFYLVGIQRYLETRQLEMIGKTVELQGLHKNGEIFPTELSFSVTEIGDEISFTGIIRDISTRHQAQVELENSHQFLLTVLESLSHPFYVINVADYTVQVANSAASSVALEKTTTCHALTHQSDQPCGSAEHPCPLEEVRRTRQAAIFEHIHYDENGDPRNVEVHAHPIFDSQGNVTQVIEYTLDITDRVQLQQEIAASRTYLENVLASAPGAIVTLDTAQNILSWNPGAQALFGYSEAETIGENIDDLIIRRDSQSLAEARHFAQQAFDGNQVSPTEVIRYHKDGSPVHVIVSGNPIFENDVVVGAVAAYADITERVLADEILSASEDRYRDLIENSQDLICTHDLNGKVLSINRRAAQLLGYTPEQLVGRNLRVGLARETRQHFDQYLDTIRSQGEASGEAAFLTANREKLIWEFHNTLRTEGVPEPIVRGMAHDITERLKAEQKIEESQARYQHIFDNAGVAIWVEDFSEVKAGIDDLKTQGVEDFSGYLDEHPEFIDQVASTIQIWDVNQATLDLLGARSKAELLQSLNIVLVPETREILRGEILAIANGKQNFAGETVNRRLDGELVHILLTAVFPADPNQFDNVLISTMDITERVQAEEKLAREQYLLNSLTDNIPDNIFFKDKDSRFIRVNPALVRDFGVSDPNDILGKTDFDFFTAEHAQKALADEQRIIQTGEAMIGEIEKGIRADGRGEIWASTTKLPLLDETGKIMGTFGIARDLTELIHLGQETQTRAELMAHLADLSEELNRPFTETEVIATIGRGVLLLSGVERAAIYLRMPDDGVACPWSQNLSPEYIDRVINQTREMPGGQFLDQSEPVLLPDIRVLPDDLLVSQLAKMEGYRAVGLWPLVYKDQVIAAFASYYDQPHTWTPAEHEVLLAFARQAAVALENARLVQKEQQRRQELARLYRASDALLTSSKPDLNHLAQTIVDTILQEFNQSNCSLFLVRPGQNELERIAVAGVYTDEVSRGHLTLDGSGLVISAIQTGQIVNVPDVSLHPSYLSNWSKTCSEISIPLKVGERVIGIIDIQSQAKNAFDGDDERLLASFADRATLAVVNAQLFSEAQQASLEMASINSQLETLNITLEERVRQRTYELEVLHELSQEISYTLDYEELFRRMLSHLHRIVSYDVAVTLILDADQPIFYQRTTRPIQDKALQDIYTHLITSYERMQTDVKLDESSFIIKTLEAMDTGLETSSDEGEALTAFNSVFQVPLISRFNRQLVGIMYVGAQAETAFSEDSVRLLYTLATQASMSLERLRSLMDVEQQRLESLVERIPDGVLLLNKDKKVVLENPAGKRYMDRLVDDFGRLALKHLGGCPIDDLLTPREDGLPHEIMAVNSGQHQIFEVDSRPIETDPEAGGWVLSLRDVTWERDLLATEITRSRELDSLYSLSREMAATDNLDMVLQTIARHTAESLHVSFSRVVLAQNGAFYCMAVFPIRQFDDDLGENQLEDEAIWPVYAKVLSENKPLMLPGDDLVMSDEVSQALMRGNAQFLCLVPLRVGNEDIGILTLGESRQASREPFEANKLRLASAIGDQSASAIHRAQLHRQTEERLSRLATLRQIDMTITSSVDLKMTLTILLDQIKTALKVDAVAVLLVYPNIHSVEYANGSGFRMKGIEKLKLRFDEGFAGQVASNRKMVIKPNLAEAIIDPRYAEIIKGDNFNAYFGVPLMAKGQIKGVLEIYSREIMRPDADWIDFLETLGGQTAIAIDSIEMFQNLQRSNMELRMAYDATIEGWSNALELRDMETEGHSQRVTEMAVTLARTLGIPDRELIHVRRGALLHDIGKMGVPDNILFKPGKLDEAEWVIMRQHPVFAYNMLAPIGFLRPALDIPHYHHERWDGTGYPQGLKGPQIPLSARIFAIIDVWDALSSDRPYRLGWPKEKVIEHLLEGSGTHFDPEVVAAFSAQLQSMKASN